MEAVYEELEEVKSEIEKLREQLRVKTEVAETLRKAHDEQLSKNKAISSQLDKLGQELNERDDEVFATKKTNEDLKSNLKEKESFIKHITAVNDKLRADNNACLVETEKISRVLNEKEDELFAAKKSNEDLKLKMKEKESFIKNLSNRLCESKEKSSQMEKILQELREKEDQIFNAQRMSDELKTKLKEKEFIIQQVSSLHDKLRMESNEKLHKCDEENKALAFALDDANSKTVDQEQQIRALKEEIEGVRRLVVVSQKKNSSECENSTKVLKEVEQREEDVFIKLEEENRRFEDQLKWKKEHFSHLEESHKKLRCEFKAREKEWETEKSLLIEDLSRLQAKLESQTRISRDLQHRFEMCEQALAHSDSKRKILEAELFEFRSRFDGLCCEFDHAKLNFEALNSKRDQDFANLRSSLSTKEVLYMEMEYQFRRIEQEKKDLLSSLKELQEDQIREARVSSSASKLQKKLKSLEREHRGCSDNLKEKELEWKTQMEKLTRELNACMSELKTRDSTMRKLEMELESCDSLMQNLDILNLETSLMLLVLRSKFSEAQIRLADANSYRDLKRSQEMQENVGTLIEQLEKKEIALSDMKCDLEEEREKVHTLSEKVRKLEELHLPLQKERESLSLLLEESSNSRAESDEHTVQLQNDLEKVNEALERANEELHEKLCEANEIEFELYLWKSIAEKLEATVEMNLQMRREVEASLLAQMEVEGNLKQEKESLSHLLDEKERRIEDLEQHLVEVSRMKADDEHISSEAENSQEEEMEKYNKIGDLQQHVTSLENEFERSTSSFYSRLHRMQKKTCSLRESREKIKEMAILKEIEIQEKNLIIQELENELEEMQERIRQQDNRDSVGSELIQKLTDENKKLLSTMNFLYEKIEHLAAEDAQLTESLGKIVQSFGTVGNSDEDDDDDIVELENMRRVFSSPSVKKGESTVYEERSPFRAINT